MSSIEKENNIINTEDLKNEIINNKIEIIENININKDENFNILTTEEYIKSRSNRNNESSFCGKSNEDINHAFLEDELNDMIKESNMDNNFNLLELDDNEENNIFEKI